VATITKVCLLALGGALLIGAIIAFIAFRRAPHGFEDDEGFHYDNHSKL